MVVSTRLLFVLRLPTTAAERLAWPAGGLSWLTTASLTVVFLRAKNVAENGHYEYWRDEYQPQSTVVTAELCDDALGNSEDT